MAESKNDFDFSDRTLRDPMIKEPGHTQAAESLEEEQAAEDTGNARDLVDKSQKQAREINFATGRLEPVADHLSAPSAPSDAARAAAAMDPDGDGEADGPADPHAGNAEQSATDDPRPRRAAKK